MCSTPPCWWHSPTMSSISDVSHLPPRSLHSRTHSRQLTTDQFTYVQVSSCWMYQAGTNKTHTATSSVLTNKGRSNFVPFWFLFQHWTLAIPQFQHNLISAKSRCAIFRKFWGAHVVWISGCHWKMTIQYGNDTVSLPVLQLIHSFICWFHPSVCLLSVATGIPCQKPIYLEQSAGQCNFSTYSVFLPPTTGNVSVLSLVPWYYIEPMDLTSPTVVPVVLYITWTTLWLTDIDQGSCRCGLLQHD